MAFRCYKFYSVYRSGTDEPVVIHATATEIQRLLGITDQTFRTYASHTKNGTRKNPFDIYLDEQEEDDTDE